MFPNLPRSVLSVMIPGISIVMRLLGPRFHHISSDPFPGYRTSFIEDTEVIGPSRLQKVTVTSAMVTVTLSKVTVTLSKVTVNLSKVTVTLSKRSEEKITLFHIKVGRTF